MNNRILKATILKKLKRRCKWGKAYTSIKNVIRSGIKMHLRGKAKEMTEEMVKEGLLLSKPKKPDPVISLNPKRRKDIEKIIKELE